MPWVNMRKQFADDTPVAVYALQRQVVPVIESEHPASHLGVSTRFRPDIVEYPDSDKFAVLGEPPGPAGEQEDFLFIGRAGGGLDYWDGE